MERSKFSDWLASASLYKPYVMSLDAAHATAEAVHKNGFRVDAFCPDCAAGTTYIATGRTDHEKKPFATRSVLYALCHSKAFSEAAQVLGAALGTFRFTCARSTKHVLQVYVRLEVQEEGTASLMKIGQFPSLLDQAKGSVQRYQTVLSSIDAQELNSAVICNSHGFHVAAYTYLRRVFERRIEVAHDAARADTNWDDAQYSPTAYMEKRIELLRKHLPTFLVEHRKLYNILSRGIHELTEKECADGYEVVHLGVSLILDEEIERNERATKIKAAGASISKLQQKFST